MAGWSKSEAYRRAQSGDMPTVRLSPKLLGVPRKRWDAIVKRALKAR
jgi:hypothetical protein